MGAVVSLTARRVQQQGLQLAHTDDQNVELSNWSIRCTDIGTSHVIGDVDDGDGQRVSSAIVEHDAQRGLIRTQSGRYYALHGPETNGSENARMLWTSFKELHGLVEVR